MTESTGLADADYIGDPSQHTGFYAFDEIDALNILLVPGVTTAQVITGGISYAEGRKDLLFIAETPIHLEPLEAVDFRKGQGMYTHAAFNSSYAALYYPWLEISDPLTGKSKLVPPTGAVAGCIARSDEKTEVWYAPAGIDRGRIFNALSLAYKTSRGERDVLYSEGINVIASFPDTGINIWGQKTLQSQPSATDRINVRRLMMYVEEAISQSSRFVVFEPNNSQTWRALVRLITPFLQNIKSKGGFYDFRVQCDEETNTRADDRSEPDGLPGVREAHQDRRVRRAQLHPDRHRRGLQGGILGWTMELMPQSLYQNWQFAIEVNGFDVALFRRARSQRPSLRKCVRSGRFDVRPEGSWADEVRGHHSGEGRARGRLGRVGARLGPDPGRCELQRRRAAGGVYARYRHRALRPCRAMRPAAGRCTARG